MSEESHDTIIRLITAHGRVGWFQVKCPTCGKVGQPQQLAEDAEAIAQRHEEVQGFER